MSNELKDHIHTWSVGKLKLYLSERNISTQGCCEKSEFVSLAVEAAALEAQKSSSAEDTSASASAAEQAVAKAASSGLPVEQSLSQAELAAAMSQLTKMSRAEPTNVTRGSNLSMDSMTADDSQKNRCQVACRLCGCMILKPGKGTRVQLERFLHYSEKSAAQSAQGGETVGEFWRVADMYDFDNMGFCRPLPNSPHDKYLTCADCEHEIIGVYHLPSHPTHPNVSLLCHDRIGYILPDQEGGVE
jgi:guanine nucleotide exchange factor